MTLFEFQNFDYFVLLRLVIAVILGGLIGLERGGSNHEAGFRTHIVLCLGAALVMVISEQLVKQHGSEDIMRMGAQVISGVGFLGVGSIVIDGNRIRGITTAAGLWTTACIGLAVGSGYYIISSFAVALMLFAMLGLRSFKSRLNSRLLKYSIKLDLENGAAIKDILRKLMDKDVQICSIKLEEDGHDICAVMEIKLQKNINSKELMSEVTACAGIKEFELI